MQTVSLRVPQDVDEDDVRELVDALQQEIDDVVVELAPHELRGYGVSYHEIIDIVLPSVVDFGAAKALEIGFRWALKRWKTDKKRREEEGVWPVPRHRVVRVYGPDGETVLREVEIKDNDGEPQITKSHE